MTNDPTKPGADKDLEAARDVLEAFNAEEVIERPGRPTEEESPTEESAVQPPG
jgi:hypothetical protein